MSQDEGADGADNVNGVGPVLDFSRVNRAWGKKWYRRITRATRLQARVLEAEEAGGELTAAKATLVADAYDEIEIIGVEQEAMVAEVLVSVPDEWVHPDAPKNIDWNEPGAFDELLYDKYRLIIEAINQARSGKN